MRKLLHLYTKLEERLLIASLVFTVVLIFVQVIMRYVFNNSLSWSEELARYIFIWQIWLGTGVGIRLKEQIRVGILAKKLSQTGAKLLNAVALIILLMFCIFLVINGYQLVMKIAGRNALSTALKIPLSYVYLSLPFSSAITSLYLIDQLVELFKPAKETEGGTI
ncbi:TRAP transporter small permease [Acidaminobacter hydrogenoformans]|uniref:TRAP-type C4-dicarboxylate transport system, small permease component n=1 Tax=Acidaminobacter hydrogenoformans DSM 2784 TaxID=1120920 RepID=A0A1G5RVR8_9FIRM|nr:TRAP transporter small permease [Acidaminobacter hydrogenoformans]SCZ78153.1 TRAP-type C4-dicarboxylate transport system, small permease component [Acidaminobacter hydrogenoformans DSM 2784]